jgi:uncharacterized protein YqgV (UPF0045/DUF77 family)
MIRKILSFFRRKKPTVAFNPHLNADFVVQRFGTGKSNSEAVRDVGKILAKNFSDIRAHGFGTEVSGDFKDTCKALEAIIQDAYSKHHREQLELRIDINPFKDKLISQRLAAV